MDKTTAAPIKPTTPAPTAPQKPTVPQRPNATVPNRPNAPVLPGNAEPNVTDGSQTTVEETSTDKSSNLFTTVENTYITYTAPDLSLSDAQANARRRNSIKQVAAAAGVGLTAAAILVIKLLYDRRKALSEDY